MTCMTYAKSQWVFKVREYCAAISMQPVTTYLSKTTLTDHFQELEVFYFQGVLPVLDELDPYAKRTSTVLYFMPLYTRNIRSDG